MTSIKTQCGAFLLLEEKEADHATAYVFKKVFEELVAGRIPNEAEFTRLTVRKTVMVCSCSPWITSP